MKQNEIEQEFHHQLVTGFSWSAIAQILRQAIFFIITILLTRLLSKEAFGLVGMVTVFSGFASIFKDLGFRAALVQKQEVTPEQYSSVFWLNLSVGLSLMGLFMLLAPLISRFYGEPLLIPLTMLIALTFLGDSVNIVQYALLLKTLNFRVIAFVEIGALVLAGGTAIVMAFSGFGVWSLVMQYVVLSFATAAIMWVASSWRPLFHFDRREIRDLFGFSSNLLGFSVLNYWLRNADNLLVGRFLGAEPLGIYSRSYALLLFPLRNISNMISRVLFPALSQVKDDIPTVQQYYLRTIATVAFIAFPLMFGLFITADNFVLVFFGESWIEMVPILRIFCLIGLLQSILTLNGNLYMSQGRTDLQLKVGGLIGFIGVGAFAIGLQWGIFGVALCYAIYSFIVAWPGLYFAVGLIEITVWQVVKHLGRIFTSAVLMGLLVWLLTFVVPVGWPLWIILASQILWGGLTYLLISYLLQVQPLSELVTISLRLLTHSR